MDTTDLVSAFKCGECFDIELKQTLMKPAWSTSSPLGYCRCYEVGPNFGVISFKNYLSLFISSDLIG